jgi:signal transduction histidine kinase
LVRRAIEGTDQLLKSLHEIATRVRPAVLDDLGLHDAVESYLEEFSHRTGIAVSADLSFPREHVPADASEHVYRILQEALTNVAKHAQTGQVSVAVRVDTRQIQLIVRDEGVGFTPERHVPTRLGILGMQERAEFLGGDMQLVSAPGEGTRVEVTIPFSPA